MSHFTNIKTKIKHKDFLIKALNTLGYNVQENVTLEVAGSHGIDHPKFDVEVSIANDIGFKQQKDGTFQLVAELDTWKELVPVERFIQQVTQAYAKCIVVDTVKDQGFEVVTEQKNSENTIEIVVEKW